MTAGTGMRDYTKYKLLNSLALACTLALLTVLLSIQETDRREVDALAAAVHGRQGVITFRLKLNERRPPRWRPVDLVEIGKLDGIEGVEWRSGTVLAQGPRTDLVVPLVDASPGLLELLATDLVAGRLFTEDDAGKRVVVVGEDIARAFAGDHATADVLGKTVNILGDNYQVIGVAPGLNAAYRPLAEPVDLSGVGRYNVNDVYVQVGDASSLPEPVASIQEHLDAQAHLEMLEAVSYREFLAGGVSGERVAFLRESQQLFRLLVALVCIFAVLNLFVVVTVMAHSQVERWAIQRVLGASRRLLLVRELLLGNMIYFVAILVGVALGLAGARRFISAQAILNIVPPALLVGFAAVLLGTVLPMARAVPLHPGPALRSGTTLRKGGGGVVFWSSSVIALALAFVIAAGGVYETGIRTLSEEIDAIGAQLIRFDPDRDSLLPVAALAPSDVEHLRELFPNARLAFVEVMTAGVRSSSGEKEVRLIRADEGYPSVSGTTLRVGTWGNGVVLGADIADDLFPEGSAVGSTVNFTGIAASIGEVEVVGVAEEPSAGPLESIQLGSDAIYVPASLVSDARSISARIYADHSSMSEPSWAALTEALNHMSAGRAPYEVVDVSASFKNYLAALSAQITRFQLAALVLVPLTAVALSMLALAGSQARSFRRAVERVLGASWRDRFWRELRAGVGALVLICFSASLGGGLVIATWTSLAGHPLVFPFEWAAAAVGAVIMIGVSVTFLQARRAIGRTPAADLGAE